jgi:hypothetical protein
MKKADVICCECGAGFQRMELSSQPGKPGAYCCPACGQVLEQYDGSKLVAYRMTVVPTIRGLRDLAAAEI